MAGTTAASSTFRVVRRAVSDVAACVAGLEPERITTSQASELFELFAELTRLGSAGQVLLAPRVSQSNTWKDEGHRSAAEWVAQTTGTALGEAIATIETAKRLESLPNTAQALRDGKLSAPQLREIATAASGRPSSELDLLDAASTCTLRGLKDRCRRVKALANSARDENARYEAIRASRFFRHWSDPDGAFRGEFKLTPDDGARVLASLSPRTDELFEQARKADRHEPTAAYAADALVDLVTRQDSRVGAPSGPPVVFHVRADAAALRRGYVADGEICEIPGVGPIPVSTARSLMSDAFVKLLVTDGVDVVTVCHVGRGISSHVRSALEERDPVCVVPGCDVAVGLEIDHWQTPYADGGPTTLANLARLCHFHHAMKTYRGFELRGGPGNWKWEPPPPFETDDTADGPGRAPPAARPGARSP
jgi:hypothetical protein